MAFRKCRCSFRASSEFDVLEGDKCLIEIGNDLELYTPMVLRVIKLSVTPHVLSMTSQVQ